MKLQFVHKEILRGKGSSVYCQWIRHPQETGAPLVAVWMDPAMNVFELQFASNPGRRLLPETCRKRRIPQNHTGTRKRIEQ